MSCSKSDRFPFQSIINIVFDIYLSRGLMISSTLGIWTYTITDHYFHWILSCSVNFVTPDNESAPDQMIFWGSWPFFSNWWRGDWSLTRNRGGSLRNIRQRSWFWSRPSWDRTVNRWRGRSPWGRGPWGRGPWGRHTWGGIPVQGWQLALVFIPPGQRRQSKRGKYHDARANTVCSISFYIY